MRGLRRYGKLGVFVPTGIGCLLLAWSHLALSETWDWIAPTEYEDGTALPVTDLMSFELVCIGQSVTFAGDQTTGVTNFPPGTYDCHMTATTINGQTSMPSMSLSFTVAQPPPPVPNPVTGLTVTP